MLSGVSRWKETGEADSDCTILTAPFAGGKSYVAHTAPISVLINKMKIICFCLAGLTVLFIFQCSSNLSTVAFLFCNLDYKRLSSLSLFVCLSLPTPFPGTHTIIVAQHMDGHLKNQEEKLAGVLRAYYDAVIFHLSGIC